MIHNEVSFNADCSDIVNSIIAKFTFRTIRAAACFPSATQPGFSLLSTFVAVVITVIVNFVLLIPMHYCLMCC